ncbi:hypothetical protein DFH09DRAFT_1181997 [Mycena vulgaris]|nr:hypothetical protein DFH09DRAFT_1181997 [Mycena vulgaris]
MASRGSDVNRPTGSERAALATCRVRITEIQSKILELERSLRSLRQEKELVQGQLDGYIYPVLTLPNEIVSEIFIHFLPVYPERPPLIGPGSPTLLGQICRKWREIALTTPALWRAVALLFLEQHRREPNLGLLDAFLTRSGSCPLSIKLVYYDTISDSDPSSRIAPFLQKIASHCARWEHLKLYVPQHSLRSITGPLPLLRSLQIGFPAADPEPSENTDDSILTSAFLTAPLLRQVNLRSHRDVYSTILPWSQLTVLTVDLVLPDQCIPILNQAVNLVYCKLLIYSGMQLQDDLDPPSSRDLTLCCLETLVLIDMFPGLGFQSRFINPLTLPALRKLHVTEQLLQSDPVHTLVSLVSRSQCDLQELWIEKPTIARYLYRNAFPSVASLIFDRNLLGEHGFIGESDTEASESTDSDIEEEAETDPDHDDSGEESNDSESSD